MGIDITLITTQIDPEMVPNFTCSICDDLLEDAVTLNCDDTFCRPCLTGWIERPGWQRNVPCPKCGHLFSPTRGIKEPSRLLRNLLSSFKFKCSNEGCDYIVSYGGSDSHKLECLYMLIKCYYCYVEIRRKDAETHKDGCIDFIKSKKRDVECENSSLKSQNDSLKRQNDYVIATKNALTNELKRLKMDFEKEPQCVITLTGKIKSPTGFFPDYEDFDVLHRQSSWEEIPGGKICVKFKKIKTETGQYSKMYLGLALVKDNATKKIDAEWSMKVWHEEGNEMVFTKDDCSHIFKKSSKVWDTDIEKFVPPEHNYFFTIKIRTWIVTMYKDRKNTRCTWSMAIRTAECDPN